MFFLIKLEKCVTIVLRFFEKCVIWVYSLELALLKNG